MITELVPLELIDDTDRIRPIEPAWAEAMAASLGDGVHLPPILVRPALPPEVREGCRYALVVGGHRMAAYRVAGHLEVRADIEELTRAEARIREVDENLIRNELNALDRAIMLRERKLAWEEAYPAVAHGGDRKSLLVNDKIKSQTLRLDQPGRFSAEAAERVGLSERSVQADIALAEMLSPEAVRHLRRTYLVDNGAELRRLASHRGADQVRIAETIARGEARNVAQARVSLRMDSPVERDAQEQIFAKVVDLLTRANKRTQRRVADHLALVLGEPKDQPRT